MENAISCRGCGVDLTGSEADCPTCGLDDPGAVGIEPTTVRTLHSGDLLEGKWKLERKLGQGGMGAVYQARDLSLDRTVAIKLLSASLCGQPALVSRFEREARLMARLDHPNIVPVHAVGKTLNQPFIVMKYLEGVTLTEYRKEHGGKLSPEAALPIVRQVCKGLDAIHAQGFIHRDIKPGNIFVAPNGHVTILDFGIARDPTSQDRTQAGMLVGTPAYMSPEQVMGKDTIDSRSDLYAFGVVLYELLTGSVPFEGASDFSVMLAHRSTPAPRADLRCVDVPVEIAQVIERVLSKAPEGRYDRAGQLFSAFKDAIAGVAVSQGRRDLTRRERSTPAPAQTDQTRFSPLTDDEVDPSAASRQGIATRQDVPRVVVPASPPLRPAPRPRDASSAAGLARLGGWQLWAPIAGAVAVSLLLFLFFRPGKHSADLERAVAKVTALPEAAPLVPTVPPVKVVATVMVPTVTVVPETERKPGTVDPDRRTRVTRAPPIRSRTEREGTLNVVTTFQGSPRWASLTVDGRNQNSTPCSLKLKPGLHRIRISQKGFAVFEAEIPIASGLNPPLKVELKK